MGAWLTGDALWAAIGTGAGMFIGAWSGRASIQRPSRVHFDRGLAWRVLVFGIPLAVSAVLGSVIDGGTRILLVRLSSAEALGYYTAASVLVQSTLFFIGAAVYTAGYSLVVQAVEREDHAEAHRQLLANGALLLAVLAPASLGLALTGKAIATLFVGPKLVSGVIPLVPWLAVSTFLGGIRAYHLDQAFQLGRRPQLQVWMQLLAGITSVALCFYLIPTNGSIGAAVALTGAMTVSSVYAWIVGRHAYKVPLPVAASVRVAVCCGVMALAVVALPDSGRTGLVLRLVTGALSYGLAALAVNLLGVRTHFGALVKHALG
jgi:O-antigen/teichoic acid export membrane protein